MNKFTQINFLTFAKENERKKDKRNYFSENLNPIFEEDLKSKYGTSKS